MSKELIDVIALDPGWRGTGWVYAEGLRDGRPMILDCGVVLNPQRAQSVRIHEEIGGLFLELTSIIQEYNPSVVVVETVHGGGKSQRAAVQMARAHSFSKL